MTTTPIQRAVAAYFNLKLGELAHPATKRQEIVMARHIAWWLERKTGKSFSAIGRLYGRADHSTVVAATNHMRERLAAGDARYVKAISDLECELSRDAKPGEQTLAERVRLLEFEVDQLKSEIRARFGPIQHLGDQPLHVTVIKGGKP